LRRFFVEELAVKTGTVALRGVDANHIRTVLRMVPGDRLILIDPKGARAEAVIVSSDRREVIVNLEKPLLSPPPSPVEINLCQALLRSHPMDLIIQKTSELGVDRILPFVSERTIVRPDREETLTNKLRHWREIALSATKQSGRIKPAEIGPLCTFGELMDRWKGKELMKIILWEEESVGSLKTILRSLPPPKKVIGVIGPEGGFSVDEIEKARNAAFVPVSLGQRILRAETAAITLTALLQYEWGDLG
jgi:16S rRNA (uracil1498-N3)-methyltransferase